jgi:glutaredoxin 3
VGKVQAGLNEMMPNITIYTKSNCPNCIAAKLLLQSKGLNFLDVNLDDDVRRSNFISAFPDLKQMPQIWIGDQRVGGLAGLREALIKLGL